MMLVRNVPLSPFFAQSYGNAHRGIKDGNDATTMCGSGVIEMAVNYIPENSEWPRPFFSNGLALIAAARANEYQVVEI
jgi:hypothetical protein